MDEPKTREEIFLAGVAGSEVSLPAPVTREELFLAKAAGMDVSAPTPVTRKEKYLANIQSGGGGGGDFELVYTTALYANNDVLSEKDKEHLMLNLTNPETYCVFVVAKVSAENYTIPVYMNPLNATTNGRFQAVNGGTLSNKTDKCEFTVTYAPNTQKFSLAKINIKSTTATNVDEFKFKIYQMK